MKAKIIEPCINYKQSKMYQKWHMIL